MRMQPPVASSQHSKEAGMYDDVPIDDPDRICVFDRYALPDVSWPHALTEFNAADRMSDAYRGCLLWGAVGDALGRAVETMPPTAVRARFGDGPTEYVPWRG